MSKFRLISKHGDAIALAHRVEEEGNIVSFWVRDHVAKPSYEGMLRQVSSWDAPMSKDTILFFDMVGMGAIAEKLQKEGYIVYGGGKVNDSLELNRDFGMKVAKTCGLKVPKWEQFSEFDSAAKYVKGTDRKWVFKPQDNRNPVFTYISDAPESMVDMLAYFKATWKGKVDFILQEKIDGTEVSIELFFHQGEPIMSTLNTTIELKRFMEGDKGPNTGCMGSVVRFWKKAEPKLYRLTLRKVLPFLRRFRYSGPLDCNCIVSERDQMPYFLEWTARFGYNAIYAFCEGLNRPVGDFLAGIAKGDGTLQPSYDWLGALRISIPPYPNGERANAEIPVKHDLSEHIWPLDVKYTNRKYVTAGVDGVVCEVTGRNKTLAGLSEKLLARAEAVVVPDKQFRSDLIPVARKRLAKLSEWKYCWQNLE